MLQVRQYQPVKYGVFPLLPLSRHRLSNCLHFRSILYIKYNNSFFSLNTGMVKRKVLVLDLDETLIHSHHEGVLRHPSKPEMPPDFILKVTIERHPVRFYVHKRPHVDFFLDVVSKKNITNIHYLLVVIIIYIFKCLYFLLNTGFKMV